MKWCRGCKQEKPESDFYKHPTTTDRLFPDCKPCHKAKAIQYFQKNKQHLRECEHLRRSRAVNKKDRKRYAKKYRKLNPEKTRARRLLNYAVNNGQIVRLNCQVCGSAMAQAHHTDYSRPYAVQWLCKRHHGEAHRKQ